MQKFSSSKGSFVQRICLQQNFENCFKMFLNQLKTLRLDPLKGDTAIVIDMLTLVRNPWIVYIKKRSCVTGFITLIGMRSVTLRGAT